MAPLLPLLLALQTRPALEPPSGEIVVTARRRCDLAAAGRPIRRRELDALAAQARAGRPVRIVVPASVRTRCLATVMFRLHDRGVTTAEFVDAPDR